MESRTCEISRFMKEIFNIAKSSSNCERLLRDVKLIAANNGNCAAQFTVSKKHLNEYGILNSRIISHLIERMTSFALMSYINKECGHSLNTNIQFLSQAGLDDKLVVDANIVKIEKPVVHIESQLWNSENDDLIAFGQSIKYLNYLPAQDQRGRRKTYRIFQNN